MISSEGLKAVIRVRPMNLREKNENCQTCIEVDNKKKQVMIFSPEDKVNQKIFEFSNCISGSSQSLFYEQTAYTLVESIFQGYNGTMFAYGQTGCGKTYTMYGIPESQDLKGIIPRTFDHIFNSITHIKDKEITVKCSYLELYNEIIHDLLQENMVQTLKIKETKDKQIEIEGLSIKSVKSGAEMDELLKLGNMNRCILGTATGKLASRSHLIFTIYINALSIDPKNKNPIQITTKLNLVDLAGSERTEKTGNSDQIHKPSYSITSLRMVINSLYQGNDSFIPYRNSKLTRILQESFELNFKTLMIAVLSPADCNYNESLDTLRVAFRAQNIQKKPYVSEVLKGTKMIDCAEEINSLKIYFQEELGFDKMELETYIKNDQKDSSEKQDE